MSRRFTPWPAAVDLFGGLAVLFVGFYSLEATKARDLTAQVEKIRQRMTEAQEHAAKVYERLTAQALVNGVTYEKCSPEDVCMNVELTFATDGDSVSSADVSRLTNVADGLRNVLKQDKDSVQIVVEGHTDCRVPLLKRGFEAFKHNWDLSSKRARSVLYQLSVFEVGTRTGYNIIAVGFADSRPKCVQGDCTPNDDVCKQQNRRTTIRMKFDYQKNGNGAAGRSAR